MGTILGIINGIKRANELQTHSFLNLLFDYDHSN